MDKTSADIAQKAKKDRQRAENWTQEEKDLLLEIMRDSAPIIENKQTDTNNNRRKNSEWLKVRNRLTELTGKSRDVLQLKGFWRRLKLNAKKNISQNKKSVRMTGGGNPPPSPSDYDQKITQLCPTDFVVEMNQFDSDAIFENVTLEEKDNVTTIVPPNSTIIYNIDLNENIPKNSNSGVTVQDINNEEVLIDEKENMTDENMNTEINLIKQSRRKNCEIKPRKTESSHKAMVLASNIEFKNFSRSLLQEEHQLKMKYQNLELSHQQLRHKMEVDILLLEKEKKELEIRLLKKSLV